MKKLYLAIVALFLMASLITVSGQEMKNCFILQPETKRAQIPDFIDTEQPTAGAATIITINPMDTIAAVSRYIYGSNANIYTGRYNQEPELIEKIELLNPTIIRYPGGLHSNEYFWNARPNNFPEDLPEKLLEGYSNNSYDPYWVPGMNTSWEFSLDNFYDFIDETGCEPLITVNYSYARYGTGPTPVQTAAKLAADWVRYDDGRTTYWEIGNENCANWASGYKIDLSLNQDGQPEYITTKLYGEHAKIFIDSMKAAAAEIGHTIYVGVQNDVGVLEGAGNAPDWLVDHTYFTPYQQNSTARTILNSVPAEAKKYANKAKTQAEKWGTDYKPITMTEYNIFAEGSRQRCSFINGMHAVLVFGELINYGYGMANRWDLLNGGNDGNDMGTFLRDNPTDIPRWTPYPAFFYIYYFQKYFGNYSVAVDVNGDENVVAYASTFSNGPIGVAVVNKGTAEQVISLDVRNYGIGEKYYIYSLTGGDDNGEFSQVVYINDYGPDYDLGGPILDLEMIEAAGYTRDTAIKFNSPARSVQFVLIDDGEYLMAVEANDPPKAEPIDADQKVAIYPNPAIDHLKVAFQAGKYHKINIVNIRGRVVYSRNLTSSETFVQLQPNLASGAYFVKFYKKQGFDVCKIMIIK